MVAGGEGGFYWKIGDLERRIVNSAMVYEEQP